MTEEQLRAEFEHEAVEEKRLANIQEKLRKPRTPHALSYPSRSIQISI